MFYYLLFGDQIWGAYKNQCILELTIYSGIKNMADMFCFVCFLFVCSFVFYLFLVNLFFEEE